MQEQGVPAPDVTLKPSIIDAYGARIPVVEANPMELKADGKARNHVVIAGGWGTDETTYEGLQRALAKDREVTTIGHPRRGGQYADGENKVTKSMPKVEKAKAQNLLAYINKTRESDAGQGGKIDLFCHSEGAINGLIAACENPEAIGNIVLFGPGGLQGKDSVLQLVKRFAGKMMLEQKQAKLDRQEVLRERYTKLPEADPKYDVPGKLTPGGVDAAWHNPDDVQATIQRASKGMIKYLLGNVKRAIQEGKAIANTDITDMLEYVHSQGIKVVVMQGVDDKAIPMGMVNPTVAKGMSESKKEKDAGLNQLVDGFISVPMLHDDPIQQDHALSEALRGVFDTLNNPPEISAGATHPSQEQGAHTKLERFTQLPAQLLNRLRR